MHTQRLERLKRSDKAAATILFRLRREVHLQEPEALSVLPDLLCVAPKSILNLVDFDVRGAYFSLKKRKGRTAGHSETTGIREAPSPSPPRPRLPKRPGCGPPLKVPTALFSPVKRRPALSVTSEETPPDDSKAEAARQAGRQPGTDEWDDMVQRDAELSRLAEERRAAEERLAKTQYVQALDEQVKERQRWLSLLRKEDEEYARLVQHQGHLAESRQQTDKQRQKRRQAEGAAARASFVELQAQKARKVGQRRAALQQEREQADNIAAEHALSEKLKQRAARLRQQELQKANVQAAERATRRAREEAARHVQELEKAEAEALKEEKARLDAQMQRRADFKSKMDAMQDIPSDVAMLEQKAWERASREAAAEERKRFQAEQAKKLAQKESQQVYINMLKLQMAAKQHAKEVQRQEAAAMLERARKADAEFHAAEAKRKADAMRRRLEICQAQKQQVHDRRRAALSSPSRQRLLRYNRSYCEGQRAALQSEKQAVALTKRVAELAPKHSAIASAERERWGTASKTSVLPAWRPGVADLNEDVLRRMDARIKLFTSKQE